MKAQGVPAGVGGHSLETPIACEKHKLNPDFYVKTFHMDRYWSATPKANREDWCWYTEWTGETTTRIYDNMWCLDADKTAAFMALGRQALGGVQGDGRRGDPSADGLLPRLPSRGRFHRGRHVRLPDRGRREDRRRGAAEGPEPHAAVARVTMAIYTRTGDQGETDLLGGPRVSKDAARPRGLRRPG